MSASTLRSASLLAALMPLCACQPPEVVGYADGPMVQLDAEINDAQFEVQFCYDGPALNEAWFQGWLDVSATGAGGEQGLELAVELPGVDAPAEDPELYRETMTVEAGERLYLAFPGEEGRFDGVSSACSEAYVLSFAVDGQFEPGQQVDVEWSAGFGGRYIENSRRDRPKDDDLSVVITAL